MNPQENSCTDHSGLSVTGALSHAYIVWGGSEAEQDAFAGKLAAALVCQSNGQRPCMSCVNCDKAFRHIHPDIVAIDKTPDAREIYVDQIRDLREDAVIMPNEASRKVYIIHNAGDMNVFAQNAILKLLEEPPPSAAFILITGNPAELLPTVRSRCVELSARRRDTMEPARICDDAVKFFDALANSSLKLAELSFTLEKLDKSAFADFIADATALLVSKMKDRSYGAGDAPSSGYLLKAVGVLDKAREYLDYNVSLGHITGMMCAELIEGDGERRRNP